MKNKEQFLHEVFAEIEYLKNNTTNEEKAKLDVDKFDHNDFNNCIYGQMTGHCESDRAIELYPKSYNIILDNKDDECTALEKYLFLINKDYQLEIVNYIKGVTNSYNKITELNRDVNVFCI